MGYMDTSLLLKVDFSGGTVIKNLPISAGDLSSIPGPEKSLHAKGQPSPWALITESAALEPLLHKKSHWNKKRTH